MNVASTVEIASVVDPNTKPSSRVHRLSRISPDDPDRKKQASSTARIADGLYTITGPRPAIRAHAVHGRAAEHSLAAWRAVSDTNLIPSPRVAGRGLGRGVRHLRATSPGE